MDIFLIHEISTAIQTKKYDSLWNSVSFLAFCLLLMDCAITGGGKWLMLGPLSLRMVLGLLSFFCAIPAILRNIKAWIRNPIFIALALFILYLIISAIIGITKGNRLDVLLSDIKGFGWLFLLPVAMAVITSRERLNFIMKCIIIAATLQAIMIIVLSLIGTFYSAWPSVFYYPIIDMQLGFMDRITYEMARVFFKSGPYLVVACIFMAYLQVKSGKFRWLYVISTGLCLNAILLSFTRSLYGATVISLALILVALLVFAVRKWKRLIIHVFIALAAAGILITAQHFVTGSNYLEFAVARTFSLDISNGQETQDSQEAYQQKQSYIDRTKESDQVVRETTIVELIGMIGKSPVFGNGLGASINYREDGLVEYFYYDLLNKTGVVGLILYYFPVGYMIYFIIRMWKKGEKDQAVPGVACLIGLVTFLTVTYFNPYMNASLGISCYSIAFGFFSLMREEYNPKLIGGGDNVKTRYPD